MVKNIGPFYNVRERVEQDPQFIEKRKRQLGVEQYRNVCGDCLLGVHIYCKSSDCVCCYSRKGMVKCGKNGTFEA